MDEKSSKAGQDTRLVVNWNERSMSIDWKQVTVDHVVAACRMFDSGAARPKRPARNTVLILDGRRYPAKFIRGLAYKFATGTELNPSRDYSGGQETVRFFSRLGLTTEHHSVVQPATAQTSNAGDMQPQSAAPPGRTPARQQRIARIALVSHDCTRTNSFCLHDYSEQFARINECCDKAGCDTILYALWTWDIRSPARRQHDTIFANLTSVDRVILEVGTPLKHAECAEVWMREFAEPLTAHQRFAKSGESDKKKRQFLDDLPERRFANGLLMLCGESNIASLIRGSDRFRDAFDFNDLLDQMDVDVICNPIHDYMRRYEMPRKRAYYSANGRWVVSVWNQGKSGESHTPWSVHHDGVDCTDCVRELPSPFSDRPDIRIGIVDVETPSRDRSPAPGRVAAASSESGRLLVIVPCGQAKVWDRAPDHGPAPARDAYTGAPFTVNRRYAERFAEKWVILSAKYGFIDPAVVLPGPYNVTFKRKSSGPVSEAKLKQQVEQLGLDRFPVVVGLGGKEYRQAIEAAFAGTPVKLHFPFAGLPIGKAMQAVNQTIEADTPIPTQKAPVGSHTHSDAGECDAAPVGVICAKLHELFRLLPVHRFPFDTAALPRNGIYILFEKGEAGHGGNRIVRVGTHTGNNQLPSRIKQHFLNEKKDRSIFRKNIGRCLLNRADDPFLEFWNLDLTSRAAREEHQHKVDFVRQKEIERQVTVFLQSHFWFVAFEVPEKAARLKLESKIISTVSLCDECRPSPGWLGLSSPKSRIRDSGLWQEKELWKTVLTDGDLGTLSEMAKT
jgi:hypothetical protein